MSLRSAHTHFVGFVMSWLKNENVVFSSIKLEIHIRVCVCMCKYDKYKNSKINREDILIYGCECVYA